MYLDKICGEIILDKFEIFVILGKFRFLKKIKYYFDILIVKKVKDI